MWQHLMSLNKGVLAFGRVQREWLFGDPVTNKRYVLDFYIPEVRLGIEVDGPIHQEEHQRVKDRAKELALDRLDIYLLRVSNEDVFGGVLKLVPRLRVAWTSAARQAAARRGPAPDTARLGCFA